MLWNGLKIWELTSMQRKNNLRNYRQTVIKLNNDHGFIEWTECSMMENMTYWNKISSLILLS